MQTIGIPCNRIVINVCLNGFVLAFVADDPIIEISLPEPGAWRFLQAVNLRRGNGFERPDKPANSFRLLFAFIIVPGPRAMQMIRLFTRRPVLRGVVL